MLNELLKVKRLREEKAEKAWVKAKQELQVKVDERVAKGKKVEDYKVWRKQEEQRLYDKIFGKTISQPKLSETREQIGLLRQKQITLQQELIELDKEVTAAEEAVLAAKKKHLEANKKVMKYEELGAIVQVAEKREDERKQEVESEDLQTHKS